MSDAEDAWKEVAELNQQWMQAYAGGDLAFLDKYMAEDLCRDLSGRYCSG